MTDHPVLRLRRRSAGGFVLEGGREGPLQALPEAEGWRHDTAERGNSAAGHLWGTDLSDEEKDALVEYLKRRDAPRR